MGFARKITENHVDTNHVETIHESSLRDSYLPCPQYVGAVVHPLEIIDAALQEIGVFLGIRCITDR